MCSRMSAVRPGLTSKLHSNRYSRSALPFSQVDVPVDAVDNVKAWWADRFSRLETMSQQFADLTDSLQESAKVAGSDKGVTTSDLG